jgi:DNA-directed RNA polymerase subunit H (RpoH/RPB5)
MSEIPEEFSKVMVDFVSDLKTTYPEYIPLISKWWKDKELFNNIENEEERDKAIKNSEKENIEYLFNFCKTKLPPRFFDILYKNEDMFRDATIDTEFLPYIHFKDLFELQISQKTRDAIWKYLQLISFSIIGTIENKDAFGDTAKLFEHIDEEEFKKKLQETLSSVQEMFDISGNFKENMDKEFNINMEDMPNLNADDINEHITSMLNGKLGKIAKEIAEETANDLNLDSDNCSNVSDVFSNLIKNPTKIMNLVKNVGSKLDTSIKSGEIKESELMEEATEIMNKMKDMPGMKDIQSMLNKMGLNKMGGKFNTGAMGSQLNKNLKLAKTKEKIRAKAEMNRILKEAQQAQAKEQQNKVIAQSPNALTEEQLIKIFNDGEKPEKTPREQNNNANTNLKKKGKK